MSCLKQMWFRGCRMHDPFQKNSLGDPPFCAHQFHSIFFLTVGFFVTDHFDGLTVLQVQIEFPQRIQSLKSFLQSSKHIPHRRALFDAALIREFLTIANHFQSVNGPCSDCLYRGRNVLNTATVRVSIAHALCRFLLRILVYAGLWIGQ